MTSPPCSPLTLLSPALHARHLSSWTRVCGGLPTHVLRLLSSRWHLRVSPETCCLSYIMKDSLKTMVWRETRSIKGFPELFEIFWAVTRWRQHLDLCGKGDRSFCSRGQFRFQSFSRLTEGFSATPIVFKGIQYIYLSVPVDTISLVCICCLSIFYSLF